MNKKVRKLISNLLVATLSISTWELGKKQYGYLKNHKTYSTIQKQKDNTGDVQAYLKEHNFDWIQVTGTAIDYPLIVAEDNSYYLTHDYKGESSSGGAIYYDASDVAYNGSNTVIYGHSMRDGSMFNNLNYFPKDVKKFESSKLIIETKDGKTEYTPLAFYVTNDNFIHRDIDSLPIGEAVKAIEQNADYYIRNTSYSNDSHLIALFTCNYSIKNGRLVVWYIKE